MYAQKNYPLTPFFANQIIKMHEGGITSILKRRHFVPEPNCKPQYAKGRPLGMDKFASLFVFYSIGCIVSLIILITENVFKPSKNLQFHSPNNLDMINLKKEAIFKAMRELDQYSNNQDLQLILLKMDEIIKKYWNTWCMIFYRLVNFERKFWVFQFFRKTNEKFLPQ